MALLFSVGSGIDLCRPAIADDFRAVGRQGASHVATNNLQPVPKFGGSSVRDPQRAVAATNQSSSHSLQWRSSPAVAPVKQAAAQAQAQAATVQLADQKPQVAGPVIQAESPAQSSIAPSQPIRTSGVVVAASKPSANQSVIAPAGLHSPGSVTGSGRVTATNTLRSSGVLGKGGVQQAQFQLPGGVVEPEQIPGTLKTPPTTDSPLPDFFADPFGDMPAPATPGVVPPTTPPAPTPPLQLPELPEPTLPQADLAPPTANGLRDLLVPDPSAAMPAKPASPAESVIPRPVPIVPDTNDQPTQSKPAPEAEVPPSRQIEDFQMPRRSEDQRPTTPRSSSDDDISLIRPVAFSCDDFRRSIAEATIQKVSLDISPPFRPDVIEFDEYKKMKQRFNEQQELRDWQSIDGRKLGRGRLRDLAYEKVIIETEFGTTEELPVSRISEADLAYISEQWGLPQECVIAQPQYQERRWERSKITWKASNLMHKPLYFEEVNLERYGHTAGPILQPVVSSAHFFANIAILPYKMGVHLPNECQYALGYYRPGDCAPWITQPVPLSLRGALFQAGAVAGTVALVP